MDDGGVRSGFKKMKYEAFEQDRAKSCNFGSGFCSEGELTKNNPTTTLDLNAKSNHLLVFENTNKASSIGKPQDSESMKILGKPRSFGLDHNPEDDSSSFNHEPFLLLKTYNHVQAQDSLSECGSTRGSVGQNESLRIWKQMKQNGFLSSSRNGVSTSAIPKPRGRKKGNESAIKKKIEIAKKEQVDRFAKVAAPSGLLNELNPGIINHVRNRRQVHSIIENLVRSTKNKDCSHRQDDDAILNRSSGCQLASYCWSGGVTGDDDSAVTERETLVRSKTIHNPTTYPNKICDDDDVLELKLSSASTMASENKSSLSNEESAYLSTVDSLSIKGARVASQWLELLHQDIKGRLSALRRSRKRVQAVTQTELPFLISKELSSNQENDPSVVISSENGISSNTKNEMHRFRWTALFDQMDKSLSEEEKHLEKSLNQVREMLLHCEHGLFQFHPENGLQQHPTLQDNYIHVKTEPILDKDLAIRAAAAAIYSTSNFLQSTHKQPCS